ncbi:MAG: hypothetical protein WC047_00220 [Kiritimatiellales bacterium]
MKITLTCGDSTINTACKGTSQHIHNKRIVHGLSRKGNDWINALLDNHGPIMTTTKYGQMRLDYITDAPLP